MNLSNPDVRAMITLTRDNPVVSGYRPAHNMPTIRKSALELDCSKALRGKGIALTAK